MYINSLIGKWKDVNKGTTKGSGSRPYLFNVSLNGLNIELKGVDILCKYADDTKNYCNPLVERWS